MLRPTALALALLPAPLAAHPHVFVEAQVGLVFDGAALVGVRLSWTYDDFFSLLLTEDLGVDPDGDMVLTEEELEIVRASVLDWPADYAGDLVLTGPAGELPLGPRIDAEVEVIEGRIIESHLRLLADPVDPGPQGVAVQVYDPFYYVAYQVVGEIAIEGTDACAAAYTPADLEAAYALLDELLYGRPASDVGPEEEFPMVGVAFADTVMVTCD
ncbi:DUF1007 family protein [Flavimaricola marinus]|uniref:Polyphosphate kinase n=1 Tax=Flavimaricola marinus TaxID=1819565 RepID=A0A238LJ72_9RHOB|nr:DUF1007 family protein [Flavimaricola marinus]SMY09454.1 hypothetical protein LOM8899_03621 [Flavimaricola marinus]